MTAPIACRLHALDASGRARQKELLETVRGKREATREIERGFELRLPSDRAIYVLAAEWISLERLCCPFAEFALEWRADDTVWVRITGPEGAKAVLAAEMGLSASF